MELDVSVLRRAIADRAMTQTDLARAAGISRARINAILKEVSVNIHPRTAVKISRALGLPETALDKHGIEQAYLRAVQEQHATLDFSGLGIVAVDGPLPLQKVFASLSVAERACNDCPSNGVHGKLAGHRIKTRPQRLAKALARRDQMFLLGDPGTGKTTSLRHMANAYAAGRQVDFAYPSDDLVPVFVRLAEWGEQLRSDAVDLIDAAVSQLRVANPAETSAWLRTQVKSRRVLLLLDGLDEVADPDLKSEVIERLRSFFEMYADLRAVITSRIVGFESPNLGSRFGAFEALPLTIDGVKAFTQAWCACRHNHATEKDCPACEQRTDAIRNAIDNNARVRALATNPMMLTTLLLLQEAGVTLPQRRWDLYEKLSEAFLFSWQEKKRVAIQGSPDRSLRLEDRELVWVLESLAIEMQRTDRTLVPRWWLAEHLRQFLDRELGLSDNQARSLSDSLIWSLQERSGFIAERGPDRFGFLHLAFQEYFAARAILASDDPIRDLRPFVYHPRWREVVRLVAGQLDRRRLSHLLRIILDDPDPAGRAIGRALLIVLGCLADGAPLCNEAFIAQLSHQTAELGRTKWLDVSLEALHLLGELRSTRLSEFAKATAARMMELSRESLPDDESAMLLMKALDRDLLDGPSDIPNDEIDDDEDETDLPVVELKGKGYFIVRRPARFHAHWGEEAIRQLKTDESPQIRAICALELERFATRRPEIRQALVAAMNAEKDPHVRCAIAQALSEGADKDAKELLLRCLSEDPDPDVRRACAAALRSEAARDGTVGQLLASLLTSDADPVIREGAAWGLSHCASNQGGMRDVLISVFNDASQEERVRIACLLALECTATATRDIVHDLLVTLSGPTEAKLTRTAAKVLAEQAADGRMKWTDLPIERIEQVLVAINEPCHHFFHALRSLVEARETRRSGIPREARIKAALASVISRIHTMFIFGSAARGEQSAESDIDLMVIGELSLREMTPGLREAEQALGRQVNAVVHTPEEWARRLRDRNPFITQVVKGEKIFIVGAADELAAMVG